jgi:hypothetical protein
MTPSPLSSQGLGCKPSQRRKSSGRKQGGQPQAISDPARRYGLYAALEQPMNQANAFVRKQQELSR